VLSNFSLVRHDEEGVAFCVQTVKKFEKVGACH
jgi:hypothetical protein